MAEIVKLEKNLINFHKAAKILDTSYDFVYNLTVVTGEIPFIDYGFKKPKRVFLEDVERYRDSHLVNIKRVV